MAFKSRIWYPVALVLSVINFVGLGQAVGAGEPWHATAHAVLALAFGVWAQRLRLHRAERQELPAGLEAIELEMSRLRQELIETQERLDFTERMLAEGKETHRMGPQP